MVIYNNNNKLYYSFGSQHCKNIYKCYNKTISKLGNLINYRKESMSLYIMASTLYNRLILLVIFIIFVTLWDGLKLVIEALPRWLERDEAFNKNSSLFPVWLCASVNYRKQHLEILMQLIRNQMCCEYFSKCLASGKYEEQ